MTRRQLLLGMPAFLQNRPQRVIVLMVDGFGADYITASTMPVLTSWHKKGIGKIVNGVMPSVTNANNASICCGAWPEKHGITANFYLDETTGREEYMESADLVLRPRFSKRRRRGSDLRAALLEEEDASRCCRAAQASFCLRKFRRPNGPNVSAKLRTFTAPRSITGC